MRTTRSRAALAVGVVALAAAPRGVAGDDAPSAALRALFSHGPDAVAAARALPASTLDLRGQRRKADLLAAHQPLGATEWAGARELPAILDAIARAVPDVAGKVDLHRIALPEHVPALLAGIDRGGPDAFAIRMACLRILADSGGADRFHDALVAAFLYSGERHAAEAAGRSPPPFPGVCPRRAGERGLPDSFERLARAAWAPPVEGEGTPVVGVGWLWRWALRLRPSIEDLPFLVEAAEWERAPKEWVFERLASLEDPAARAEVEEWARASGLARAAIAAARAGRGDPSMLRDLQRPRRDEREATVAAERATLVSWSFDPERARAAWIDGFLESEDPSQHEPTLDADGRWRLALEGVEVREEDLRWIGVELLRSGAPARHLNYWFTRVRPEDLTPARAREVCARLAEHRDGLPYWAESSESDVEGNVSLGVLEGYDREAVARLLRTWAASNEQDVRRDALLHLARLGDETFVDDMVRSWPDWDLDSWAIGNVRHAKVRDLLRARLSSVREEEAETVADAFAALLASHGFSLRHPYAFARDATWTEEPFRSARAALLGGDAAGALALLADEVSAEDLAFVRDERVLARLRAWRDGRDEERRWDATGLLALGDRAAEAEVRGFVADARMPLLDANQGALWLTLAGDPALVRLWASRLDANCCLSFHAKCALRRVFPTVPANNAAAHTTFFRRETERFLARNRGRFVWSRLLRGWVPGPAR